VAVDETVPLQQPTRRSRQSRTQQLARNREGLTGAHERCYVREVEFAILGPLTVRRDGRELSLGSAKQRALLAVLLLHAGETMTKEGLIAALWGERRPRSAVKALQGYVSQLRNTLGTGVLVTRAPGYVLELEPGALDTQRFEQLLADGRRLFEQGEAKEAGDVLRAALLLWRGEPLVDFRYETFAANAIGRLQKLRLIALELRLEADLAAGRHAEAVPELESLVREYPLREGVRRLLMLALYRCGRQADALAVMADGRAQLREELGLDPGNALQQLERAILQHDPALDGDRSPPLRAMPPAPEAPGRVGPGRVGPGLLCGACGTRNPPGAAYCRACGTPLAVDSSLETRKTVTVLFCDVVASSALAERLDPEALRHVMSEFFELGASVIERHGGTVEKFVGDEVMAVFGVPLVREDDALRAVRAAVELRERLPAESELAGTTLVVRIGVNTGEVVAGDPTAGHGFVTGEPVVIGKRLQQAAAPGEILLGERTYRLVAHAVDAAPLSAPNVKDETAEMPAYRLQALDAEAKALPRHDDAPLVGREREQRLLVETWQRVVGERTCCLFTVVGVAGVGKSRLAAEFFASLGGTTAVRGRCLPYGEGITYRPVIDVIEQLPPVELDPLAAGAIRSLLGMEARRASADEIGWAFRKLLAGAAAERPLVVLFDDIQWAEERFLDLVEQVALLSSDTPILLLCLARPELLDAYPRWPVALRLEPLSAHEAEKLIDDRLAGREVTPELRDRILHAAGGNPLFVEEMVAVLSQTTHGEVVVVPATIQALLAARLDQLEPTERRVLELASVEGEVFHRGAVQALMGDDTQVLSRLTALVHKQVIRPGKAQLPGEDGFRFQHLLIRDVAYEAILKSTRAELHEQYADWLHEHGAGLADLDELMGYHLEMAYGYQTELGHSDPRAGAVAVRAAGHLAAAGRRALARLDTAAATNLLRRARDLPSRNSWQFDLDLATALRMTGRIAEADAILGATTAEAATRGDRRAELHARLAELEFSELAVSNRDLAEQALREFVQANDEAGAIRAWVAIGAIERSRCRFAESGKAFEHALLLARKTGDERVANAALLQLVNLLVWGPTPVEDALRWIDGQGTYQEHPLVLSPRAQLEAMLGRFDEARSLLARASDRWGELVGQEDPGIWEAGYRIEKLADDDDAAEHAIRRACEILAERGERPHRSSLMGELARVLCALGRFDEAEECSRLAEELGMGDDVATEMLWRQTRATVLARRGDWTAALRLARQAVALGEQADDLNAHGDALLDLGDVLALSGRRDEAAAPLEQARALYVSKGNLVMAARIPAPAASARTENATRLG
jgi:class 3 adenylate cyclase/DNA-binding SARP family transcriptional activator